MSRADSMNMLENAILVTSTALAVHYLPRILRRRIPIRIGGTTHPGFEVVKEVFKKNFESGRDPRHSGSAFAVFHRGECVVDVFGGYADAEIRQPWNQNTLSLVYSTTKAVAAVCIAVLADRGLLDYDKPVAEYWPEFAENGKERITVQQLLEHKAGLPIAPRPLTYATLGDCARCGSMLAAAPPRWEVDGSHGYHAITFGPLTNELLRRVDPKGRRMGTFFEEEIAKPFGIDFFIGLPLEENHRVAKLIFPDLGPKVALTSLRSARNRMALRGLLRDRSLVTESVLNAGELTDFRTQNDPEKRAIEIPSANGFGTASSLAKLMGILAVGGTDPSSGRTLLSRATTDSFLQSEPETVDRVAKVAISWRRGMLIDYTEEGDKIYGHPGAGGQAAFSDPRHQLGFAFTSRYSAPFGMGDDPRYIALRKAMYSCVKSIESQRTT